MKHNAAVTILWHRFLCSSSLDFITVILRGFSECFAPHFIEAECSYECSLFANRFTIALFNLKHVAKIAKHLLLSSGLMNKAKALLVRQIITFCQFHNLQSVLDCYDSKLCISLTCLWKLEDSCKALPQFIALKISSALSPSKSDETAGGRMAVVNYSKSGGHIGGKIFGKHENGPKLNPQQPTPIIQCAGLNTNILNLQIRGQHTIYCFIKSCKAYQSQVSGAGGRGRQCSDIAISLYANNLAHLEQRNILRTLSAPNVSLTTSGSIIRDTVLCLPEKRSGRFIEPAELFCMKMRCARPSHDQDSDIKTSFLPFPKLQHNYDVLNSMLNLADNFTLAPEGQTGGTTGQRKGWGNRVINSLTDLVDVLTSMPKLQCKKADPVGTRRGGAELVRLFMEHGVPMKAETLALTLTLLHLRKAKSLRTHHIIKFVHDSIKSAVHKLGLSPLSHQDVGGASFSDLIVQLNCLTTSSHQKKEGLRVFLRIKGILKELKAGSVCWNREKQSCCAEPGIRKMLRFITKIGWLVTVLLQHTEYQGIIMALSNLTKPIERLFDNIFILNITNGGAAVVETIERLLRPFLSFLY